MRSTQIKFHFYLFTCLTVICTYGQSCQEQLEEARTFYRNGELHLVKSALEGCLSRKNLDKSELIEANRLLANTAFNLDSVENGTTYLENLLNLDLSFKADHSDVFRFRNNLEDLRHHPDLQIGIRMGLSLPEVVIGDVYDDIYDRENAFSVGGIPNGKLIGQVKTSVSPLLSLVMVKKVSHHIEVETGIGFRTTRFTYFDEVWRSERETRVHDFVAPLLINYHIPFMINGNILTVQGGATFSMLQSWQHNDQAGGEINADASDIRTSINYGWVAGVFMDWSVGNLMLRPQFQYSLGLTSRSETISDSDNAALIYNDPTFVNYNSRFNYFELSLAVLKQRF